MAQHPRQHALTIAAASHLHSVGHLSMGQRDAIHKDARKKLELHKARKPKGPPPMPPFGSIAPTTHYMVNPPMPPAAAPAGAATEER